MLKECFKAKNGKGFSAAQASTKPFLVFKYFSAFKVQVRYEHH